jgi:hypothetical protein
MKDTDVIAALAPVLGMLLQWLRAYRWFNDGLTFLVAILGGALGSWLVLEVFVLKQFVFQAFLFTPAILGGTMLASMASHATPVVPKWNSASKS